jgi:5'-3' exonuclease
MDYNGIVYSAYERIKEKIEGAENTKDKIEELLITEVLRYTKYLICEVVKPTKIAYIALDGPAPRAKMVQQRSRRYIKQDTKMIIKNEKIRLKIPIDENEWDQSANISPGTQFMQKLTEALLNVMKHNGFSTHCNSMEVFLSDSNVPGEGEHKFLPIVRQMRTKKSTENSSVYFYGSDADLIVLGVSMHKKNLHIIREVADTKDIMKMYEFYEFIDVNINELSNAFNHDLTRTFKNHSYDKTRILNDYIFLTFLVGNDFVLSMQYLKIRNEGLKSLIAIYHNVKENHEDYLINYHPDNKIAPVINVPFFKDFIFNLSKIEIEQMKNKQIEIDKLMKGHRSDYSINAESKMTPLEIFTSRYEHTEVCSPFHPLFEKYHQEFKKINYKQDYEIWKEEYYKYFLNIDKNNIEEYYNVRMNLVKNYFESLMFTLKYYLQGCPSWTWYYKYRIPPLMSDVYEALDKNIYDINQLHFELSKPYTPFQQLMLILPPQMDALVPSVLRPIMNDDKLLCTQFYPIEFKLDVTAGIKTMYSEAILPEIDEELLISVVKKCEEKLTLEEKERNKMGTVKKFEQKKT